MRLRISLAVISLAALVGVGVGAWYFIWQDRACAQLLQESRKAFDAGENEKAVALSEAASRKHVVAKRRAEAALLRGKARSALGQTDEALTAFEAAMNLDPTLSEPYAARAMIRRGKGEQDAALQDLNDAIGRGFAEPAAFFERALIHLERNEAEQALLDFDEALRHGGDGFKISLTRARAFVALNNLDAAIENLDRALEIDPQNQEARALRGDLHFKKNDVDKALADYAELRTPQGDSGSMRTEQMWAARKAETAAPQVYSDVTSLLMRAAAAYQTGKLDEALDLYNAILRMDVSLPVASTACQNRGNVYRAKGDNERALQDYEQAIRFNPANPGAYVNRGLVFAQRGDHESAIKDYTEAFRFDPKMFEAIFNRALSYRETGDEAAAERDLTQVLEMNPKFAAAYIYRAGLRLQSGQLDQALADYGTAATLEPTAGEAVFGRALVYLKKRAYAQAATELEKTIQLKPRSMAEILNSLAWLRATCPQKSLRNGKKAVELSLQACDLNRWENGSLVDTLAASYAEAGEFDNAVRFQEMALNLPGLGLEHRPGAEARLKLYRQRRPYRDTNPES